ncbi:acyl-CoA thioester hydrolase/BAAT C-terminal domain-containing protein [Paenibacillus thiaminolyticus]|uniref:acyl-CoA thioester hydrolase/BAAT C-terminal domain-containing protein n=1 Tax=Paenibacillus thiaminolyticus TaxID=49283 RepID=UPI003D2D5620
MVNQLQFEVAETSLLDDRLDIRVRHAPTAGTVTLRAATTDEEGVAWRSYAVFRSDDSGVIDVGRQAPLEGTYRTADAMGLFWSMKPSASAPEIFQKAGSDPLQVTLTAEIDGTIVAERQLVRQVIADEVERIPLNPDELGIAGTFFRPRAVERRPPAVLVLAGSGGGVNECMTGLLASRGYAALALAYFGVGPLPSQLREIPLEYFEKAVSWLKSQPGIRHESIAVVGRSKGGELALLLGATYPELHPVVSYVPSPYLFSSFVGGTPASSWTHKGEPLPFVPLRMNLALLFRILSRRFTKQPISFASLYEKSVKLKPDWGGAMIPLERIQGPVLLISGGDDKTWPSTYFSEVAAARLREKEFPYPVRHLSYPYAGHMIQAPYLPSTVHRSGTLLLGGSDDKDAEACADSWAKMLDFLDNHCKRTEDQEESQ